MSKIGGWTLKVDNHADDFPACVLLTKSDESGESVSYSPIRTVKRVSVPHESHVALGHYECSACKTLVNPYDSFCRHCGARLTGGR